MLVYGMKTSDIESIYDDYYADSEEDEFSRIQRGWRQLGARFKAANIAKAYLPKPEDCILDIGGGMGDVSAELVNAHSFPRIALVDISASGVRIAEARPEIKDATVFDGYQVDVADRSVDFAFATHVLEHVPDPRKFLREVHRLSKRAFIEIPIDYHHRSINAKVLLSYGHVNVFTPSTARFLLESEGFKILQEFPSNMQRDYSVKYYNHFRNFGVKDTFRNRTAFNFKHYFERSKNYLRRKKRFSSEYCFLIEPDDNFEIESLVEMQSNKSRDA